MIRNLICLFVVILGIACTLTLKAQESKLTPLFDGKSLNGWKVRSGYATYRVENGTIIGTTAEGSGNSFLCTLKEYSDFVLEFEVKCDPQLNSGVQFRSHFYEKETAVIGGAKGTVVKWPADRVYGYQFEVSPEGSGQVYDEARRRMMIGAPYLATEKLKTGEWNKCRIIARGDHIRTFVNNVAIADFHDNYDTKGIIGLQVHQVKQGEGPYSVSFRNVMISEFK